MPLPIEGTVWPPPGWGSAMERYRLDEALWLNDTDTLKSIYGQGSGQGTSFDTTSGSRVAPKFLRKAVLNLARRWNFARPLPTNQLRTDLPVPIGSNLASLSGTQLMAESPIVRVLTKTAASSDSKPTAASSVIQDRVDLVCNGVDAAMTNIEGAQVTSALGATVLKLGWDRNDDERESVWFEAVGGDAAFPEWANDKLFAINLFHEYESPHASKVYRHIERHERGFVVHALYHGTAVNVGRMVPLQDVPTLAWIAGVQGAVPVGNAPFAVALPTGTNRLTAAFWRNLPSRAQRRNGIMSMLGRSDFEGIEPLIDAYSEAWGSMMRDIRIGKARAMVPASMLRQGMPGEGGQFDSDQEFYAGLEFLNPDANAQQIVTYQANIRYEEHLGTLAALKLEILDGAGWSLSSYGNPMGDQSGGVTATEVVDRTTKSERTRDEKALYYKQAALPFLRTAMEIDGLIYQGKGGGRFDDLAINFPDVSQVDPEKQARTFLDLSTAHGISIWQTVRERRPNWDDAEVDLEVERILEDMKTQTGGMPDPTQVGRDGIDLTDPAAPTEDANSADNGTAKDATNGNA